MVDDYLNERFGLLVVRRAKISIRFVRDVVEVEYFLLVRSNYKTFSATITGEATLKRSRRVE